MTKRTLISAPDKHLLLRLTDGVVEMGLGPVLYGWRVRAGYCEEGGKPCQMYECDWCCGDNEETTWGTYHIMKRLLEDGISFQKLPAASATKPWFKDPLFTDELIGIAIKYGIGPGSEETLYNSRVDPIPDLYALRQEYMKQMWADAGSEI